MRAISPFPFALGAYIVVVASAAWAGCGGASGDAPPRDGGAEEAADLDAADGQTRDSSGATDGAPALFDAGPACASYCANLMSACTGEALQFPTIGACLQACVFYTEGDAGDYGSNTLACRVYHLNLVGDASASTVGHCWHAGPYGYGGCGAQCDSFCVLAVGWCGSSRGGDALASMASCMSACTSTPALQLTNAGEWPYRVDGPTVGDSRECREHYLSAALVGESARAVNCANVAMPSPTCR